MLDPVTITSVLAAGTQALSLLKTAAEAMKAAGKPEAVGQLAEVQLAMMDLLQKQQFLIEDNRSLRERVHGLETTLQIREELAFHYSAYWRRAADGGLDGPYSPTHWDLHQRLVRMRRWGRDVYEGVDKINFYEPNSKDDAYAPVDFLKKHNVPALQEEPPGSPNREE